MVYTLQYRSTAFYTVQYTGRSTERSTSSGIRVLAPRTATNYDDRPTRGGGAPSSIIIAPPAPSEPAATNPFLPRRQAR